MSVKSPTILVIDDEAINIQIAAEILGGSYRILGATDGEGGMPVKNEYYSEDVMATMYHKLGLPEDLHAQAPDGRPVKLLEGRVIKEWA